MLKQLGGGDCVSSAGKFQCFSPLYDNIKSPSLHRKSTNIGTTAVTVMKLPNHKPSNVFHAWVWLNELRNTDLCFTRVDVLSASWLIVWLVGWFSRENQSYRRKEGIYLVLCQLELTSNK